ncbi:transmembrane protein 229B-like [Acanthaster planci]|uniref:Transmembrane protein 229B-like n=1 Tax=Acanthaster planci TaxID=133434 RepID=A0A8B7XKI4_ACAPL|nr:transmembrane protein 229B-like [Acanthaster planci]
MRGSSNTSNGAVTRMMHGKRGKRAKATPRMDVSDNRSTESSSVSDVRQDESSYQPLPLMARLFFYGMHGFLDEVIFTALYEIVIHNKPNYQLVGYTSIYSFFIYGSASYVVERLYVSLRHRVPLAPRIALYVCVAYTWELCSGLLLRQFDACSWDYSDHAYNFMGLITLAYAPCWALCGLWQDVLTRYLLNLRVVPPQMKLI